MNMGHPLRNDRKEKEDSPARSWSIVISMALIFFLWGMLIFFFVGVTWPPPWEYGTIPDVPGQSVYSVQTAEEKAGTAFSPSNDIPVQHVMGSPGDKEKSGWQK
jgi:hypothetical protein